MKKFKIALFKSLYCQQPSTTEIKESAHTHTHAHIITPCCVYSSKHKHRSLFTHSYKMQHNPDIFSSHSYKNGISAFQIPQLNDGENISVITKVFQKWQRKQFSELDALSSRKVLRGNFSSIISWNKHITVNSWHRKFVHSISFSSQSLSLVIFTLKFVNHTLKFFPATIIITIFIPLSSSPELLSTDSSIYTTALSGCWLEEQCGIIWQHFY